MISKLKQLFTTQLKDDQVAVPDHFDLLKVIDRLSFEDKEKIFVRLFGKPIRIIKIKDPNGDSYYESVGLLEASELIESGNKKGGNFDYVQ